MRTQASSQDSLLAGSANSFGALCCFCLNVPGQVTLQTLLLASFRMDEALGTK